MTFGDIDIYQARFAQKERIIYIVMKGCGGSLQLGSSEY